MAIIFGKGDRFAVPHVSSESSLIGTTVLYTEPTYDIFFSKYGFCLPLDPEGTPIEYLIDDKIPKLGKLEIIPTPHRFLRITSEGQLFRVLIMNSEEPIVSQKPIFPNNDGWWIINRSSDDEFTEELLGCLMNDPTEEFLSEYHHRRNLGIPLQWFSISDILSNSKLKEFL